MCDGDKGGEKSKKKERLDLFKFWSVEYFCHLFSNQQGLHVTPDPCFQAGRGDPHPQQRVHALYNLQGELDWMVRCRWLCFTNGGERVLTSTPVCLREVRRCSLSPGIISCSRQTSCGFSSAVCELTLLWLSRRGSGIMLGKLAQPEGWWNAPQAEISQEKFLMEFWQHAITFPQQELLVRAPLMSDKKGKKNTRLLFLPLCLFLLLSLSLNIWLKKWNRSSQVFKKHTKMSVRFSPCPF